MPGSGPGFHALQLVVTFRPTSSAGKKLVMRTGSRAGLEQFIEYRRPSSDSRTMLHSRRQTINSKINKGMVHGAKNFPLCRTLLGRK